MYPKLWFSRGITSAVMAIASYFFAFAAAAATLGSDSNSSRCLQDQSLPQTQLTAVWANDGLEKVPQEEIRVKQAPCRSANGIKGRLPTQRSVVNSKWNGSEVRLFGGRNEVVAFNLVLEAANSNAEEISVAFDKLIGPNEFAIRSQLAKDSDGLFSWVNRDIELFYVRYLEIKSLSTLVYGTYDERHVPEGLRLPRFDNGTYHGGWADRPNHNKHYPDIAVPLELHPTFTVRSGQNQSIWVDIYIPADAVPGAYAGELQVKERGRTKHVVPVKLTVHHFTLPDMPTSKTMIAISYEQVARRYTGTRSPKAGSAEDRVTRLVMDRQFLVAHRHKLSLIDGNSGAESWRQERPRPEWIGRLSGALFTPLRGYRGPGVGVGNNVYSIGTYGAWQRWWRKFSKTALWTNANKWEQWFHDNFPTTERFLYLIDESQDFAQTEQWARWMKSNPGIGRNLPSLATVNLLAAAEFIPSLTYIASTIAAGDRHLAEPRQRLFLYNGMRPASGTFAIEDDGVALREIPWGQHKKRVHRWFYWDATYYDDFHNKRGETNVFTEARTYANEPKVSSNGEGVLFYPGTDKAFPQESYDINGPISSLRLKYWRRGIQDIDYITLAKQFDRKGVQAIIDRMVPKVLWETGISDPKDPTWVWAEISWSSNPGDWEAARAELARIIERGMLHETHPKGSFGQLNQDRSNRR
jgi:hypothetical protein